MNGISGFVLLVVVSGALALCLYPLLRPNLRSLLDKTVGPAGATEFYLRCFFWLLLLSALGPAVGKDFDLKPDARQIEYVWAFFRDWGVRSNQYSSL
jgi:hypothetical protein